MSDATPPNAAASPGERGAQALSAEAIEAILADFRAWLLQATDIPAAEPDVPFEVATVVQQFTALRHEVNLQTKASRAQLEQNAAALEALQQAIEPRDEVSDDGNELLRPLLKTLVDAHDALSLAECEVQRLRSKAPAPLLTSAPPDIKIKVPHWARWLGLDFSIEAQLAPLRAWVATQSGMPSLPHDDTHRQALDALMVGYRMSLQRIERALEQYGLKPIACVGQPFDPETMEVAEVMREPGRTGTEVLQEIRRGYRWHGRLFRCAQVRVARPLI
jgi:molecular chaperone GrpE